MALPFPALACATGALFKGTFFFIGEGIFFTFFGEGFFIAFFFATAFFTVFFAVAFFGLLASPCFVLFLPIGIFD
ncbi:MAG TPA: hypothetical protein VNJ07_09450 [Chitinophagales bacterium]|nr:hypothetical protein [Chitinophagales bacterium]